DRSRDEFMRSFLLPVLASLAVTAAASSAPAQEYPTRQITLIAPWPAGGAVDALCRAVAPHLSDRLGKSVVVENRPGAGSVIGTAAGAKAAPDGYTMVMAGSGSLAIRHDVQETSLRSDQGFHPPGAWRQDSIHSRRQPVLAGALGRRARTIRQAKS